MSDAVANDVMPEAPQEQQHEEQPEELIEAPVTGDDAVDVAVSGLAHAMAGPLEEQLAAYDAAHRTLQARLADVEG